MKKVALFTVGCLLLASSAWSQNRPLKKVENSYYIEFNGKDHLVNTKVVTVKFKSGITQSSVTLDTIRANKLGYIDISVSTCTDFVEFLNSLIHSEDFSSIEYHSIGEFSSVTTVPNDPMVINQWYLQATKVFDAWHITTGDPSVRLAIIDAACLNFDFYDFYDFFLPDFQSNGFFVKKNAKPWQQKGYFCIYRVRNNFFNIKYK